FRQAVSVLAYRQMAAGDTTACSTPGVGARLCPAVPDGWLQGVRHGAPGPLRKVGATAAPPGHRAGPEAPVDACAAAALCAGGQDHAPTAAGRRQASGGVRDA